MRIPVIHQLRDSGPEQVVHDRQIVELLDQIDEGFRADDSTNLEKLNIARKYGPVLLELKLFVAHGQFMKTLKERFPQVSYPKCNRWMAIAKKEAEVAAAIEKFPDVAWGPKKMLDYLLNPNEDLGVDEEESSDFLSEDNLTEEPLLPPWDRKKIVLDHTSPYALGALNKKFAAKVNRYQRQVAKKRRQLIR